MGVATGDIDHFVLEFRGYSSWWSGHNMLVRFDNVGNPNSVPEPSLGLLLGISLIGLVGVGAVRKIKQKKAVANT